MYRWLLAVLIVLGSAATLNAMGRIPTAADLTGQAAPDFTLDTLNAKQVNMTAYRAGHPAIIFFWATWCPHCREQLKELQAKADEILRDGIKLILVNVEENPTDVAEYAGAHPLPGDVFLDVDGALSRPYQIVGVPTLYFVNAKGLIVSAGHVLPDNFAEFFKNP